jgi:hypothetical protein
MCDGAPRRRRGLSAYVTRLNGPFVRSGIGLWRPHSNLNFFHQWPDGRGSETSGSVTDLIPLTFRSKFWCVRTAFRRAFISAAASGRDSVDEFGLQNGMISRIRGTLLQDSPANMVLLPFF